MSTEPANPLWLKSSRSYSAGECVEVAWLDDGHIGVRDSKNQTGPALTFSPGEWSAFTIEVRSGGYVPEP